MPRVDQPTPSPPRRATAQPAHLQAGQRRRLVRRANANPTVPRSRTTPVLTGSSSATSSLVHRVASAFAPAPTPAPAPADDQNSSAMSTPTREAPGRGNPSFSLDLGTPSPTSTEGRKKKDLFSWKRKHGEGDTPSFLPTSPLPQSEVNKKARQFLGLPQNTEEAQQQHQHQYQQQHQQQHVAIASELGENTSAGPPRTSSDKQSKFREENLPPTGPPPAGPSMIKGFRRLNWKEGHQKAKKFFERLPSQSSQSKDSERDDGSDELVLPRHNFQDLDAGYGSDSESYIRRSAFTPTDQSRGSDRSSRKKSSKRLEKMSPITEGINSEDGNRYEDDMHDTELEVISEYELKPGPDAYRSLVEESFYTSEDDTDEDVRQKVEEDVGSQNPLNRSNSHCLPANTDPPRVEEKSALQRAEETYLKNLEERVKLDAEIADLTVRYEEWKRDLPDYVTTRNTAPSQRTASSLSTTQLRTLEREPVLYQQGGWQYGRRYGPGDIKLIDIAKKPLPPAPEGPAPEGPKHHCVRGGHIFQPIKIGLAPDNIAINNLAVRPYLHTQNGTKQHVHIPIKCDNCNRDVDEELWECEIPVCRLSVCYRCAIQMQQNSEVRALGSWAASASGSR